MTRAERTQPRGPSFHSQDGLVRVSIGLESTQDILRDLKQALDGCDDGK
jgi:cystathionine beta-lyase/cystathionine gamma-synthase